MNYSKLIRNHGDYFDDLEDTDLFVFAEGLLSVPALQPTGNWRQDLRSYLANRAPRNGCKLRPRGKSVTGMGFALTLPKCVCILELLNVDPRITAAVLKAAKVCLVLVELLATRLKQRPDGIRRSQVVAFAAFQRLTDGSLPMPHRHVHLGVLSLAWNDATRFQRVTSANLEVVSHSGDLLQTLFQHQVASELRQLGYPRMVATLRPESIARPVTVLPTTYFGLISARTTRNSFQSYPGTSIILVRTPGGGSCSGSAVLFATTSATFSMFVWFSAPCASAWSVRLSSFSGRVPMNFFAASVAATQNATSTNLASKLVSVSFIRLLETERKKAGTRATAATPIPKILGRYHLSITLPDGITTSW